MSDEAPPLLGEDRGLIRELVGDGRLPLVATALALVLSGGFAILLSVRREFLPHDVAFLGMTAGQLCAVADCRIVRFMFHDRVAFGGTLLAIAAIYLWLALFPLRQGARWAWWTFLVSSVLGFGSFLAYLGYGYLDSWHGVATLAVLPVQAIGLVASRPFATLKMRGWLTTSEGREAPVRVRTGRWGLLLSGGGIALAGFVILYIGITEVFVAEDLGFMGLTRGALDSVSPRLVPLIAHDRAGFGGGLITAGILILMCAWYAPPSRSFHQAMLLTGLAGFGCAIGTHFVEGYINPLHLAPAFAGAGLFGSSVACEMLGSRRAQRS